MIFKLPCKKEKLKEWKKEREEKKEQRKEGRRKNFEVVKGKHTIEK